MEDRRINVPITSKAFEQLRALAAVERRRPQDQAARLLEEAIARRAARIEVQP